jgi:hypothetical protein
MRVHVLDGHGSFVWMVDESDTLQRASVALAVDGGCLLIDPVDDPDLDERLGGLLPVAGVVTLIDRHRRDAEAVAARHGTPRLVPSVLAGQGQPLEWPGIQERVILSVLGWNESALWLPERRLLVCVEAVGTTGPFLARATDRLGVHPLLRLRPPRGALAVDPEAIAVGHGPPVLDGASDALREALRTARSGLPGAVTRWGRAAVDAVRHAGS